MEPRSGDFRELLKGTTPLLILTLLANEPLHGYAIARAIEQHSRSLLSLGEGSLYPTLHALERDGLVRSRWEAAATGPARKVYLLTAKGEVELALRLKHWHQFVGAINGVLGAADARA